MLNIKLFFSLDEAISIFRNAGLKVEMREMPFYFENPHGDNGRDEMIPVWTVENPNTQQPEILETFFEKFIQTKKTEIFLNPGKLEIFKLFEK